MKIKIKIVKSRPPSRDCCDISKFIGREFEVNKDNFFVANTGKGVYVDEIGDIFEDEYEIIK